MNRHDILFLEGNRKMSEKLATARYLLKQIKFSGISFDVDANDVITAIGYNYLRKKGPFTEEELNSYIDILNQCEELSIKDIAQRLKNKGFQQKDRTYQYTINDCVRLKVRDTNENYYAMLYNNYNYCSIELQNNNQLIIKEDVSLHNLSHVYTIPLDETISKLMQIESFFAQTTLIQYCYYSIQSIKELDTDIILNLCKISCSYLLDSNIPKEKRSEYKQSLDCNSKEMKAIFAQYKPLCTFENTYEEMLDLQADSLKIKMLYRDVDKLDFSAFDLITNETFGSNSIFVILTDFKEKIRKQKEDKSVEFKYYINFKDLEFYPYWKR